MVKKKNITLLLSSFLLATLCTACGEKAEISQEIKEGNNRYIYAVYDDTILYHDPAGVKLLDCETMETASLCNIPNCTHTSSDCIVKALQKEDQLPVIYNGDAYYFENHFALVERGGINVMDIKFTVKKYNFQSCEFSEMLTENGHLADVCAGGCLIGSDYYFITSTGESDTDEVGNVISFGGNGTPYLYRLDLEKGTVTDLGAIFDYEGLAEKHPTLRNSCTMNYKGKIGNKLYIGISYADEEPTETAPDTILGMTYTYDLETKTFEQFDDHFSMCTMNGYHTYYDDGGENVKLTIRDISTGESFEGPDILGWCAVSVFGGKVWHGSGMCFDIKTGVEEKLPFDNGFVIAEYKDDYIFMDSSGNAHTFQKLPISDYEQE